MQEGRSATSRFGDRRRGLLRVLHEALRVDAPHARRRGTRVRRHDRRGERLLGHRTAPARDLGMLPYVMVEDIDRTLERARELGGETVTPRLALGPGDSFAVLRDPAGNLVGLYQGR